ncbi:uracil-DNA glycosylase [Serinicoccus chungangensis]|uniref:uracil-DNA glycosylase n=1 Tax=Serinicoccus chungangensis TaxID=767452 RepID=UPI001EE8A0EA|nr:uracil-DNA glycosylase [Serinicoccus chungangensis]
MEDESAQAQAAGAHIDPARLSPPALGRGWHEALQEQLSSTFWPLLLEFLATERSHHNVYPPRCQTFRAFELTPLAEVRVVILGQDPYPNEGQAHGLAFSVPMGITPPPSLVNIFRVLQDDLSAAGTPVAAPQTGDLSGWAEQGVLLLNTVLTVRAGDRTDRLSHRRWRAAGTRQGWTTFTDAVIRAVNARTDRVVFLLWGNDAKKKARLIDHPGRHTVITSSHPSPLSAWRGFLKSRPFTEANVALGRERQINWGLTESTSEVQRSDRGSTPR